MLKSNGNIVNNDCNMNLIKHHEREVQSKPRGIGMVQKECAQVYLLKIGAISYLQSVYGVFNCLCVQKNCCLILLLADNCMHHNAKSNGRLRITCEQIDVTSKLQTLKNTRKKVKVNQMSIFPIVSCAISAKFHCIWWMFSVYSYEFFYAFVFWLFRDIHTVC